MSGKKVDVEFSTIITDQFCGYLRFSRFVDHKRINHKRWFAIGDIHTNTIESFWSLLKRGIIGQYHKVSVRHLQRYIDEFCYRQNHRGCDIFALTLVRAVGGNV